MSRAKLYAMKAESRRRLGSQTLALGALGLLAVSFTLLSPMPDLSTKVGRHLCAGALANASLTVLLVIIAAIPLRQGYRWAFWAYLVPLVIYGLPILLIDASHVSRANLVTTLAPQVAGDLVVIIGLVLVAPTLEKSTKQRIFQPPSHSSR